MDTKTGGFYKLTEEYLKEFLPKREQVEREEWETRPSTKTGLNRSEHNRIIFTIGETVLVKGHPFRVVACKKRGRLELKSIPLPDAKEGGG